MADFANIAAAQAAGYKVVNQGIGAGGVGFVTILEKIGTGTTGEDAYSMHAHGFDYLSQANADANAISSLNAQRSARYGYQEAAGELDDSNNAVTADVT